MIKRTKYSQRIPWIWEMRSIPDLCKIHFHGVAGQKPGCCELKMGEKHKEKRLNRFHLYLESKKKKKGKINE